MLASQTKVWSAALGSKYRGEATTGFYLWDKVSESRFAMRLTCSGLKDRNEMAWAPSPTTKVQCGRTLTGSACLGQTIRPNIARIKENTPKMPGSGIQSEFTATKTAPSIATAHNKKTADKSFLEEALLSCSCLLRSFSFSVACTLFETVNPLAWTADNSVYGPSGGDECSRMCPPEGLSRLDPDLRAIILVRDMEDMDYEEISGILDIPRGTVKDRKH